MRPDHREELATAVERFLADIRRLARAALQQQRDRLVGAARPGAKSKPAVARGAREVTVDTEPKRARAVTADVEAKRSPPARAVVAKRVRSGTNDLERHGPTPAAVPVPVIVESAVPTVSTPAAPTTSTTATTSSRCRGTVKWFDAGKGYGFIRGDDGVDAFVHHSAVSEAGFRAFNPGQIVEYDVVFTHKGVQAVALGIGQER